MANKVPAHGPLDARIMVVGEAPGWEEEQKGLPFVGASGQELDRMLGEVGIYRKSCYVTNVCKVRPPQNQIKNFFYTKTEAKKRGISAYGNRYPNQHVVDGIGELHQEIAQVKPSIILALGDTALWALTGESGITKWRGSMLYYGQSEEKAKRSSGGSMLTASSGLETSSRKEEEKARIRVMPTYHPAAVLRQWTWRTPMVNDMKRLAQHVDTDWPLPDYQFIIRPSFVQVMEYLREFEYLLEQAPTRVAVDIETRYGHIACVGLARSDREAICIPIMCTENRQGYWPLEEEHAIICRLRKIFQHPNCLTIGQNYLYDAQYFARWWGFLPPCYLDTMLAHHVIFLGDLPKGLDFLSSIYCRYHRYWKDEGKEWTILVDEEQLWTYNCKDAVVTFECAENIEKVIAANKLRPQLDFQMSMFKPVLRAMLRGVRWDQEKVGRYAEELLAAMSEHEAWFTRVMPEGILPKGKTPYYRSPMQLQKLFYDLMKIEPVTNRKTQEPSTDDEALEKLCRKEPLIAPLCRRIMEYRSLGVFYRNFVSARIDSDKRIRCSYNIAGTETLRLASSKDAFGFGINLQNIPR